MLSNIVIASLLVILAALGGAASFWKSIGSLIERHLGILVSFSAGLFLVVAYEMGDEAVAHSDTAGSALLWIIAGMFLVWLPFKLMPLFHHHHDEQCEKHHSEIDIRRILTGNGLHNVGDGVLIAATFAASPALGWAAAFSVFIHELVQETSTFFVLKRGGFTTSGALLANLLVSGTILIGSLGGFFLLETFKALETPLLGLSAGAFLIVVLIDLLPHSYRQSKSEGNLFSHLVAFTIGLILMLGITLVAGHSHDHEHGHDHEHNHHDHDEHHEHHEHHDRHH